MIVYYQIDNEGKLSFSARLQATKARYQRKNERSNNEANNIPLSDQEGGSNNLSSGQEWRQQQPIILQKWSQQLSIITARQRAITAHYQRKN